MTRTDLCVCGRGYISVRLPSEPRRIPHHILQHFFLACEGCIVIFFIALPQVKSVMTFKRISASQTVGMNVWKFNHMVGTSGRIVTLTLCSLIVQHYMWEFIKIGCICRGVVHVSLTETAWLLVALQKLFVSVCCCASLFTLTAKKWQIVAVWLGSCRHPAGSHGNPPSVAPVGRPATQPALLCIFLFALVEGTRLTGRLLMSWLIATLYTILKLCRWGDVNLSRLLFFVSQLALHQWGSHIGR